VGAESKEFDERGDWGSSLLDVRTFISSAYHTSLAVSLILDSRRASNGCSEHISHQQRGTGTGSPCLESTSRVLALRNMAISKQVGGNCLLGRGPSAITHIKIKPITCVYVPLRKRDRVNAPARQKEGRGRAGWASLFVMWLNQSSPFPWYFVYKQSTHTGCLCSR